MIADDGDCKVVTSEKLRIELVRYADLTEDLKLCAHLKIDLLQMRSLLHHPLAKPSDPAVMVLKRGSSVAGRFGFIPGHIKIDDEVHRMFWGSSWSFDGNPQNRSGAGLLLLRAVKEAETLGGLGISHLATPIYRAAGFDMGILQRRVFLLRSMPVIKRRIGSPTIAQWICSGIDLGLTAARKTVDAAASMYCRDYRVVQVDRLGAGIEQLDSLARGKWRFPRSSDEFTWAMTWPWYDGDSFGYSAFQLYGPQSEVIGYAFVRRKYIPWASSKGYRNLKLGSVLRFTVLAKEDMRGSVALLAGVVRSLANDGVDAVEVCSTQKSLMSAAAWLGAARAGEMRVAMKAGGHTREKLNSVQASLQSFDMDGGEGDCFVG